MKENMSIKEILLDLVSVRSDTGTEMELDMADKIAEYFSHDKYFKENPDCWGKDQIGDHLGRTTVWALKRGKTSRTLILTGHYDAVEIECYGSFKPFALSPYQLEQEILAAGRADERLRRDIQSGEWLLGRGTADMKGGLALGIHKILTHPKDSEAGILFVAVCDEENMSKGARSASETLLKLREKFELEYQAIIILEPQLLLGAEPSEESKESEKSEEEKKENFVVYNGSIGKILPTIVTRGVLSHCGEPVKGLNAAHLAAEIAGRIDLNCELTTEDLNLSTQAPIVQMIRDLKTTYDVSLPEYAALTVNLLFLGADKVSAIMEKILYICREATDAVMRKYETAYEYSHIRGLISHTEKVEKYPIILELNQLEEMAAKNMFKKVYDSTSLKNITSFDEPAEFAEFVEFKAQMGEELRKKINCGEMTLQTASVEYIKRMIETSGYDGAMVVVGISPPYYPSVCNEYLDQRAGQQLEIVRQVIEENCDMKLKIMPYFTGIGDASYMSFIDPSVERKVMKNLTLPKSCYDIPFEDIAKINTPCMYIGPRCYEIHQWSERVYMPDLEETVPHIIDALLADK